MALFYNNETQFDRTIDQGDLADLPRLSRQLDSVRPYNFEVEIQFPPAAGGTDLDANKVLLLQVAAKQVSEIGYTVEDIEVHRVNDRYYYPGKATPEEVTITFDNLRHDALGYGTSPMGLLYQWVSQTYNPLTGFFGDIHTGIKTNMKIMQLDHNNQPQGAVTLYGAYPKSYKTAEYNYATATDMHTLTASFRYDFMSGDDKSFV
jgi:hypothetical protein